MGDKPKIGATVGCLNITDRGEGVNNESGFRYS